MTVSNYNSNYANSRMVAGINQEKNNDSNNNNEKEKK